MLSSMDFHAGTAKMRWKLYCRGATTDDGVLQCTYCFAEPLSSWAVKMLEQFTACCVDPMHYSNASWTIQPLMHVDV